MSLAKCQTHDTFVGVNAKRVAGGDSSEGQEVAEDEGGCLPTPDSRS